MKPHVVHPLAPALAQNLRDFAAICRGVNGMRRLNLGCIGARATAFKTTRFDEIALQKHGINVESFDLSELFFKVQNMSDDALVNKNWTRNFRFYTDAERIQYRNHPSFLHCLAWRIVSGFPPLSSLLTHRLRGCGLDNGSNPDNQ